MSLQGFIFKCCVWSSIRAYTLLQKLSCDLSGEYNAYGVPATPTPLIFTVLQHDFSTLCCLTSSSDMLKIKRTHFAAAVSGEICALLCCDDKSWSSGRTLSVTVARRKHAKQSFVIQCFAEHLVAPGRNVADLAMFVQLWSPRHFEGSFVVVIVLWNANNNVMIICKTKPCLVRHQKTRDEICWKLSVEVSFKRNFFSSELKLHQLCGESQLPRTQCQVKI